MWKSRNQTKSKWRRTILFFLLSISLFLSFSVSLSLFLYISHSHTHYLQNQHHDWALLKEWKIIRAVFDEIFFLQMSKRPFRWHPFGERRFVEETFHLLDSSKYFAFNIRHSEGKCFLGENQLGGRRRKRIATGTSVSRRNRKEAAAFFFDAEKKQTKTATFVRLINNRNYDAAEWERKSSPLMNG